jgi:plastocyanin
MASRSRLALCFAVGMALVMPGAAQAAVKSVNMGLSEKAGAPLRPYLADANAFFPSNVAIHVGDSVRFVPASFHSAHLLGKSGKILPINVLTGKTIAGITDAAGVPFFFNGLPEVGSNPALFAPPGNFGKTIVTNGTKEIESGLPTARNPKPMVVKFTKAGLFTYLCDLHPGMKGTVRVAPKRKPVPSPAADAKRVKAQFAKDLTVAKTFPSIKPPANTVYVGYTGAGGTTLFGFAPSKLTVAVGTTVTFTTAKAITETHTASTGPGNPDKEPTSYLGTIATGQDDQRLAYPSDPPPAGPAALTPLLHGNGFWNSGALDPLAASPPPASNSVTFAAAGTYEFYCLIHTFMHGTITAQ